MSLKLWGHRKCWEADSVSLWLDTGWSPISAIMGLMLAWLLGYLCRYPQREFLLSWNLKLEEWFCGPPAPILDWGQVTGFFPSASNLLSSPLSLPVFPGDRETRKSSFFLTSSSSKYFFFMYVSLIFLLQLFITTLSTWGKVKEYYICILNSEIQPVSLLLLMMSFPYHVPSLLNSLECISSKHNPNTTSTVPKKVKTTL